MLMTIRAIPPGVSSYTTMAVDDGEPSPLAKMTPREEKLLCEYYEKLARISAEVEKERSDAPTDILLSKPRENNLETVPVESDKELIPAEKVELIFRKVNTMTAAELKVELREIQVSTHGTCNQLRNRLRQFYRKEFSLLQHRREIKRVKAKNLSRFRYLVAIDIEATCESQTNDINYQHETIELPAVLIDCASWQIIDKFRTFVRPEINPMITPFCTELTHISQEDVDDAPTFPEAWFRLLEWMERHGMMGGDEYASFAIVTDGPNDLQHFLQRSFLQYGMKIPHEFRHFINIKKTFEGIVAPISSKGDGKSSISKMCEQLGLEMEGLAHQGIMDAINVARITIALVIDKKATLRINYRIVRKKGAKLCLPPPCTPEELESIMSRSERPNRGNHRPNMFNAAPSRLPYRLKSVSPQEFNAESYWDCESCGEED